MSKKKDLLDSYEGLFSEEELLRGRTMTPRPMEFDASDGDIFLTAEEVEAQEMEDGTVQYVPIQADPEDVETIEPFHLHRPIREHKYTETEMAEIRESCDTVIVRDYGEDDRYHWTDEKIAETDVLNEIRMKLDCMTKVYRRIDLYIEAMRTMMQAWTILEDHYNFVHDTEEFWDMVADGRVYSSGIIVPRMKGLDKYNIDLVIKYISDPTLDPKDLLPRENKKEKDEDLRDDFFRWMHDDEEIKKRRENEEAEERAEALRLLDINELKTRAWHKQHPDDIPTMEVCELKAKYVRGYDTKLVFNSKKKKKMSKQDRFTSEQLHPLLRKIQRNPNLRSGGRDVSSILISSSMFDPDDQKKEDVWDGVFYEGSWADEVGTEILELAIDEAILDTHPIGDSYMTYRDKEMQKFFRALEAGGKINVAELRRSMNATDEDQQQRSKLHETKINRRAESALLQRITKLNNNPKFKKLISKAEKHLNKGDDD